MRFREAVTAVLFLTIASTTSAQWTNAAALQRFNHQIDAYMTIRHQAEARVGAPFVSSDPADLLRNEAALAIAIRKGRPNAQQGDIFNDVIGFELCRRIQGVLDRHHVSDVDLLTGFGSESPHDAARVAVNSAFDWRLGAMMPASIIEALPSVPWPLEYRFVAGDLILLDVDARLIVDVLPQALGQ